MGTIRIFKAKNLLFIGLLSLSVGTQAQFSLSPHYVGLNNSRDSVLIIFENFIRLGLNKGRSNYDTVFTYNTIDSLRQYARSKHNTNLEQDALLLKAFYMGWLTPDSIRAAELIMQVKKDAEESGNVYLQLKATNLLARYYYENNKYQHAFEQYLEQWPLLINIPDAEFPDKRNSIYSIANIYYDFGDYKQAVYYLLQAKDVQTSAYNTTHYTMYNTLGLAYSKLGMPDSSDYYFKVLLNLSDCPPIWKCVVQGNLAENYFNRQQYSTAIPLLKAGVKTADSLGEIGLQSHAAMLIADIALRQNNMPEAEKYSQMAQQVLEKSKNGTNHSNEPYYRFKDLYFLLAKLYAAQGNIQQSIIYTDSAIAAKDSIARQFNTLKQLRAQQTLDYQQHFAQITQLKQKKQMQRNLLLMFIGCLGITAIFIYINQRKRHNNLQLQSQLALQQNQQQLIIATAQLKEFTNHIATKNQLLESLEAQLDASNVDAIAQLRNSSILTNEEWERFRLLFEQVHSGYLQNLRQKYPSISPAEIRFMALARLNFSNKEMAASLGVSPDAVRVVWYRLRKKLQLPEQTTLEQLVQSI